MLVLAYDKGELEFLVWIHYCVYLLYNASLRKLHLKSYTACMFSYVFIFIQIFTIFTATIFAKMFINSTQHFAGVAKIS